MPITAKSLFPVFFFSQPYFSYIFVRILKESNKKLAEIKSLIRKFKFCELNLIKFKTASKKELTRIFFAVYNPFKKNLTAKNSFFLSILPFFMLFLSFRSSPKQWKLMFILLSDRMTNRLNFFLTNDHRQTFYLGMGSNQYKKKYPLNYVSISILQSPEMCTSSND